MKKTMKTLLALMAGVMTFSACSNENILSDENPTNTPGGKGVRSFTAYTESDAATRATIDGLDVKWEASDVITVFGDNSGKYKLTEGAGYTSGKFEVQEGDGVEGTDFYAICPAAGEERNVTEEEAWAIASNYITKEIFDKVKYGGDPSDILGTEEYIKWEKVTSNNHRWVTGFITSNPKVPACTMEGNKVKNVFLPFAQTVDVEKGQVVDPKAVLMVAKADENKNLYFKNVCSYIKVRTTKPCKKIVVQSNRAHDAIAGIYDVEVSENPTISPADRSEGDGPSIITLQAKEGDLAAKTTYYIAVVPGTYKDGISVKFYTTDEYVTERTSDESITLERNNVYSGGKQPEDPTLGIKGVDKLKIGDKEYDMIWYQLWAGGPRFAITNVCKEYYTGMYNIEDEETYKTNIADSESTSMSFYDAIKSGSEYAWGSNWYTPDQEDLDELMKAAQGDETAKVTCTLSDEFGRFGFIFRGKGEYEGNAVFFHVQTPGGTDDAEAHYWSSTADGSEGWRMTLYKSGGTWQSLWDPYDKTEKYYVRPVLKR